MLQFIYIKEAILDGHLVTTSYTSLKEALKSEGLEHTYMATRRILLTGKPANFNKITFKKVKLIHQRYGKRK